MNGSYAISVFAHTSIRPIVLNCYRQFIAPGDTTTCLRTQYAAYVLPINKISTINSKWILLTLTHFQWRANFAIQNKMSSNWYESIDDLNTAMAHTLSYIIQKQMRRHQMSEDFDWFLSIRKLVNGNQLTSGELTCSENERKRQNRFLFAAIQNSMIFERTFPRLVSCICSIFDLIHTNTQWHECMCACRVSKLPEHGNEREWEKSWTRIKKWNILMVCARLMSSSTYTHTHTHRPVSHRRLPDFAGATKCDDDVISANKKRQERTNEKTRENQTNKNRNDLPSRQNIINNKWKDKKYYYTIMPRRDARTKSHNLKIRWRLLAYGCDIRIHPNNCAYFADVHYYAVITIPLHI